MKHIDLNDPRLTAYALGELAGADRDMVSALIEGDPDALREVEAIRQMAGVITDELQETGIVLPDTAKEKPQEGTVLAVGPGRTLDDGSREAMDIKEGQRVLYAKYAGTEFKVEGEDLLIVSQKDILAIVED